MAKVTIVITDEVFGNEVGSRTRMDFEPKTPDRPEDFTQAQNLAMMIVEFLKKVTQGEMTTGREQGGEMKLTTEKFGEVDANVSKRFPAQFSKSVN
jgi:hypothetical protein